MVLGRLAVLWHVCACLAGVAPLRGKPYQGRRINHHRAVRKGTPPELVAVVVCEAMSKKSAMKSRSNSSPAPVAASDGTGREACRMTDIRWP